MKTVNKILFKRSWVFALVAILALTLAACGKSKNKMPIGSLTDKAYVTTDGFTISEKELYEEMRLSGTNVLTKMFHEILYKDELAQIEADKEAYKDDFLYYVNKAIFSQTDLEKLKELPESVITKNVLSYIDAMDILGVSITEADINTTNFEDHSDVVLDYYKLDVAKRIYARKQLDEDVKDKESTSYIDIEKDIPAYFKNNVEKRYPLSYISVRFSNLFESETILRKKAIASHLGKWYKIPDPRVEVVSGYALTVLTEVGYEEKNGDGTLTEAEFQKYYDKYKTKIDPQRPLLEGPDVALTDDEAFVQLLEIYNEVYPYKDPIDTESFTTIEGFIANEAFVNVGETQGLFSFGYDDFPAKPNNSIGTIRTYLYNTLSTKENGIRFTAQPRQFGSYYYILFKLVDHNEAVLEQLDNDEFKVYQEDGKTLTENAQAYFEKIKETKLTDAYVNQLATDRLNEAKVEFFDENLHLSIRNDAFKLSKKSSANVVVTIDGTEITVEDFYKRLESQLGVSVAMDMAMNKALLASEYRKEITAKQIDEYRANIENMIRQFSQDAFKNSGFPKEMGRAKFLKLAFRADSIDEAVEKVYITPELEKLYLKDIEAHYGEAVYDKLATIANKVQNQYFSLTSSHILIYVDMDEDESPDVPSEFFETLSEEKQLEYKNQVNLLMQTIYDKASQYSKISTGLENIAEQFAKSAKVKPENCDTIEGENDPSCTWADFKKLGLQVKYESLGAKTNQTNYPDSQQQFDEKFFERLIALYDHVKETYYDVDNKFPDYELDTRPSTYADVLETNFGWHLILATNGAVATSAKFTQEDDSKYKDDDEYMIYEHIIVKDRNGKEIALNAYSDTDAITANQVRIFLNQSQTTEGIISLPIKVKTALQSYLSPVVSKYENNQNNLFLIHKFLAKVNFTYATAENNNRLENLLKVNQNQFLLYAQTNEMFMEVYGDWFTIFD